MGNRRNGVLIGSVFGSNKIFIQDLDESHNFDANLINWMTTIVRL